MDTISLTYRGPLPASKPRNSKSAQKHAVRLEISHQLQNLWDDEPVLREITGEQGFAPAVLERGRIKLIQPRLGQKYAHARVEEFGYRIIPLVTCFSGLVCHLTIEFLRRDDPGGIFTRGDMDNRLKTVLDSLRMPQSNQEVRHGGNGEDLYCLLEDDSLVTKVTIDTPKLLTRKPVDEPEDYAELLIKASIKIRRRHRATAALVSG